MIRLINSYHNSDYRNPKIHLIFKHASEKITLKSFSPHKILILDEDQIKYVQSLKENFILSSVDLGTFKVLNTNVNTPYILMEKKFFFAEIKNCFMPYIPGPNYFKDVPSSYWYTRNLKYGKNYSKKKIEKLSKNGELDIKNIETAEIETDKIIEPSFLSFDIEVESKGKFPQHGENPITHISIYYRTSGTEKFISLANHNFLEDKSLKCSTYKEIEKEFISEKKEIYLQASEITMITFFQDLLSYNPTFVLHFNGNSFDFPYISERATMLGHNFLIYTVNGLESLKFEKTKLSTFNTNKIKNETFFINFDLFHYVVNNYNSLPNKKLNTFAFEVLKSKGKIEIIEGKPHIIFNNINKYFLKSLKRCDSLKIQNIDEDILYIEKIIKEGDICKIQLKEISDKIPLNKKFFFSSGKHEIDPVSAYLDYSDKLHHEMADYCMQDSYLCYLIFRSLDLGNLLFKSGDICKIPPHMFINTKKNSMLLHHIIEKCFEQRIIINHNKKEKEEHYKGAVVIQPRENYGKTYSSIFDFNSLYPNTFIHCNLSPEKLVKTGTIKINNYLIDINKLRESYPYPDYIVIPEINQLDIDVEKEYLENDEIKYDIFDRREIGLIPLILKSLLDDRKKTKQEIKNLNKNDENFLNDYSNLDTKQYTLKILANSIYGLTPKNFFLLNSLSAARSCTSFSRNIELFMISIIDDLTLDLLSGKFIKNNNLIMKKMLNYPGSNRIFTNLDIQFLDDESCLEIMNYISSNKVLFKVIYGDTDSFFVKITNITSALDNSSLIKKIFITLDKYIQKVLEDYPFHNMECEGIIKNIIFTSKKKYMGEKMELNSNDWEFYTKGSSVIKKDYSKVHKYIIKTVYELFSSPNIELRDIINFVVKYFKDDFKNKDNKELIKKYTMVKKYNKEYSSESYMDKRMKNFNENGFKKIEVGDNYIIAYMTDYDDPLNFKIQTVEQYVTRIEDINNPPIGKNNKRIFFEKYILLITKELSSMFVNSNIDKEIENKLLS